MKSLIQRLSLGLSFVALLLPISAVAHESAIPHLPIANEYWHVFLSSFISFAIFGLLTFIVSRWFIQHLQSK